MKSLGGIIILILCLMKVCMGFSPMYYEYHLQCNENTPTTSRCTFSDVNGDQYTKWHYEPAPDTRWQYRVRPDNVQDVVFTQCTLPEIPKGLFGYYTKVRTLTCQRAQILGIYKYTFIGATQLYKLDLSFNNVSTITDKVFSDCTTLAYITLSDNRIEKLGEYAFYGLQHLKSLDLQHNRIREIHPATFYVLTSIEIIILAENDIEVLHDKIFMKNYKLSHIDLSNNKLKEVNGKMFEELKNLTVLNLANNYLREFSTEFFLVKKLFLAGNVIEYVYIVHNIELLDATNNHMKGLKIKPGISVGNLKVRNNSLTDVKQFCSISSLTSLDLSFNPIEIDQNTFSTLIHLSTLDLQHCGMKKLPKNVFGALKNMKNLNLAHNNLEYFDHSWILNTNEKLMNLYLDGNHLSEFNFNAIKHKFDNFSEIGLSNNDFDCNYLKELVAQIRSYKVKVFFEEPVTNAPNVEFIGCVDKPAHLIACDEKFGPKCTFTGVEGNLREYWRYEAFVDVQVIEQIIFTKSVIREIPRGMLQYFRNVQYLTIVECYVEEIYEYTFNGGQALKQIDLSHNKIKELRPTIFIECISITELIIEYNELYIIQPGAFQGLSHLESLSLVGNDLTTLDTQIFSPLSSIKSIDLSSNEIIIIEELIFVQNPQLQQVNLSKNKIKQIPAQIFHNQKNVAVNLQGNELQNYQPLENVEEVWLEGNHLETVKIPAQTQYFRCENNHVKSIEISENIEYLITELILTNNSLQDVNGLSKLKQLENLDLSYNKPQLNPDTFKYNQKVKTLKLIECEITYIYETLFIHMPQLEVLDLSKNHLKSFDMKTIQTNTQLQTLNLQNCELTEITNIELIQNHLPQLKEVYLDGNNFVCQYLKNVIEFFKKRGIKVLPSNPPATGPNSYGGILCKNFNKLDDVEIMQPNGQNGFLTEKQVNKPAPVPVPGGHGGDITPPDSLEFKGDKQICCTEIVELKAKVKKLEEEIFACKQKTIDYVNEAMALKKQEIEAQVRVLVNQMLNEKSQKSAGNTYLHSRFQNEEFTG